jgi:hypothetical protein
VSLYNEPRPFGADEIRAAVAGAGKVARLRRAQWNERG